MLFILTGFHLLCRVFGFTDESADDVIYINWLNMARSGLLALEFYTPETRAWRQVKHTSCFLHVYCGGICMNFIFGWLHINVHVDYSIMNAQQTGSWFS
jgi:hypothetical protein